jgi:hypothetical protein
MSDTKEFDVVRIARSDGADTGPGYWPITSTPAATAKKTAKDAPEKAPRLKPQMTRLEENDPRFVEWRVKLGILLKQELAPNPDGKSFRTMLLQLAFLSLLTASYRRKRVVCAVPTWVLAVRKVEASVGVWLSGQSQAVQEPPRVWHPLAMASLSIKELRRLLLCSLQRSQCQQDQLSQRGYAHHHAQ